MNPATDEPPPDDEEQLASWLAELDDALRSGHDTTRLIDAPGVKAARPRLLRDMDCLELLRRHRPRGAVADAVGAPGGPTLGKIGRFEIRRELGHGGSGMVFLAHDPVLRRDVALKVPRVNVLATPALRTRFEDEARAAALLDHPNIAAVYETGQAGPVTYIAAAFCPGVTLAQWIADAKGAVPESQAAALIKLLADAVQHAHSRGVLHRDLKPANVMLVPHGSEDQAGDDALESKLPFTPRITDFGLAKVLADAEVAQTYSGAILGTPSYMSPEQAAGDVAAITTATDVYGLGAILYELLTGRPPFVAEGALQTMRLIESDDPERPSRWRPDVSADLESVCLMCLHRDPRRRYGTAAALASDLTRFLNHEPVEARPVTRRERLWLWSRRNRTTAALLSVVGALVLLLTIGAPLSAVALRRQRDAADLARKDALAMLWDASLARARAARHLDRPGRRFDSLKSIGHAAELRPSIELRNEAAACFPLPDARLLRRWQAAPEGWDYLCADSNLTHYARVDAGGNVSVRTIEDDREAGVVPATGARPSHGTFSPGGESLALRYPGDSVRAWDWRAGRERANVPMPPGPTASYAQAFSRDGRMLWAALDDGTIRRVGVDGGEGLPPLRFGDVPAAFSLSPDEKLLAVVLWNHSDILLVDAISGTTRGTLATQAHAVQGFSWSADGRQLASGNGDTRLYVWDVETLKLQQALVGHENVSTGCMFHPASNLLVSTGWDRRVRVWDVPAGRQVLSLPGESMVLSADGTRMLIPRHRDAELWELSPGSTFRTLRAPEARGIGPLSLDIDPSGKWLATDGDDGARVWCLATGRQLLHLPIGRVRMAHFEPADNQFITSSEVGVQRWKLSGAGGEAALTAELVSRVGEPSGNRQAALSRDGRRLATVAGHAHAKVIDPANPSAKALVLAQHHGIGSLSISPDGRWVATCTQHGSGIKVWDAQTGALAADLPAGPYSRATFSGDGRTLVTASQNHLTTVWDVPTWRRRLSFPTATAVALTPDGSILAVAHDDVVTLFSTSTGEELVTLEPPHRMPIADIRFMPDGSRLAAGCFTAQTSHVIQLWELDGLRHQLGKMELDWAVDKVIAPW